MEHTNDFSKRIKAKRNKVLTLLQTKYSYSKEEAEDALQWRLDECNEEFVVKESEEELAACIHRDYPFHKWYQTLSKEEKEAFTKKIFHQPAILRQLQESKENRLYHFDNDVEGEQNIEEIDEEALFHDPDVIRQLEQSQEDIKNGRIYGKEDGLAYLRKRIQELNDAKKESNEPTALPTEKNTKKRGQ